MTYFLAVLAYVLPTFPLGYFWHLKTFAPAYGRLEIYRKDVIIPMGLGSMILQGLFFAWVYPKLFDTSPEGWVSGSLSFFAIMGLLAWSFLVLPVAAKVRMTDVRRFIVLETAFTAIQFAVAAVLLGLVYRGA